MSRLTVALGASAVEQLEHWMCTTPHAPAILEEDRTTSYGELDQRSQQLAALLRREHGVGIDRAVAVVAERGVSQVVGLVAVLRAGGVYVPINPGLPAERMMWMLDEADPVAILCDGPPPLAIAGRSIVRLDKPLTLTTPFAPFAAPPDALAYIVFTSGSTGRPKGVMIPRRGFDAQIHWTQSAFALDAHDRMMQLAASMFDFSIVEMIAPLSVGGAVILPPPGGELQPHVLGALAEQHAATIVHFVPSLFRVVLAACKAEPWRTVETTLCGGEAVTLDLVRDCHMVFPNAKLYNQYGPTETSVIATFWPADVREKAVSIGDAVTGTTTYVLDGELSRTSSGELWIGGEKLARGYLGRPDLTAERFVPDPFGLPGGRMYRTGDYVRESDTGLEYLGRTDFQVKIRGIRIEPGEIEARLMHHRGVRQAVVIAREDEIGDKRLVAYVVAGETGTEKEPRLWPSIGEYDVYDALIYAGLANDLLRQEKYRRALAQVVPGKIVLDIGTGGDAVLARMCAELGAARVYAVEILESSYRAAVERVAKAGLADRIVVLHGDARTIVLPELADICVSEIVEAIGGAEGAARIIDDARRLWRPDGIVIPERSVTLIAAAMLPDRLDRDPAFTPLSAHYVEQIFARTGGMFDLRLCVQDFPADHLLSSHGVLEDLDYTQPCELGFHTTTTLEIDKPGRMTGLLAWLRLYIGAGEILDILEEETAWFPVYLPAFDPGVDVQPGDIVELVCSATASDNGLNPDYLVEGTLVRANRVLERFRHASVHHDPSVRGGPYYRRLFVNDLIPSRVPAAVSAAELRRTLRAALPEYMIPSAFVLLEALPLTPNGKIDRAALPIPIAVGEESVAPRNEIEETLATIWKEVLGLTMIGVHDNFFELGGHSLLAVQLIERLRRLGITTDVRSLFSAPTVAALASTFGSHHDVNIPPNVIASDMTAISPDDLPLIDLEQTDIDRIVSRVPGGVANIQDIYALSPLQEGILFHHLLARGGDPYVLFSQMVFPNRALMDRYLRAVQVLVDRHDILRTAFAWQGINAAAQVVWRQASLNITEVRLEPTGMAAAEQLAQRFDPQHHRIDLTQAPLLRLAIAQEPGSDRWVLTELLHHLIGDHSTLETMRNEVETVMRGQQQQLLPAQPFRNLVAQVRLGVPLKEHEQFFRRMLGDVDESTTPFGLTEVHRDGSDVEEARVVLPVQLISRLRAQARRLGVTIASLSHLAWGQVVARTSGREDVVFGTVLLGRMHGGMDRAMGPHINTLPLRINLDDTSVERKVRQTHVLLADLLRHEHASLALAQRCSQVPGTEPLFSALLNYHHSVAMDVDGATERPLEGVEWTEAIERTNYPIVLSMEEVGNAARLIAQVAHPLSAQRVCRMMERTLEQLADALEKAPTTAVRMLDVLPVEERTLLLETCSSIDGAYPTDCIHTLFERSAARIPEAIAIVQGEVVLTYAELNAHANRLAHRLIGLGVGPDKLVALCAERRPHLVVGILAILKAGGAYMPLDPSYPREGLRERLRDARPMVVLADAAGRDVIELDVHGDLRVELLGDVADWSDEPASNPEVPGLTSAHLAYVIYTSGSTGTPKGVMVEHAQVARLFEATETLYNFTECDVWCLFHSFAFDFSVWELWGALRYGGRLVIVPREIARSPNAFYDLVCEMGVTVLNQTPSAFRGFIEARRQSDQKHQLRYVILGGEALEMSLLRPWYESESVRSPRVVNMYGITETTVHVTYRALSGEDVDSQGSSIGRPIPDLHCYLLDKHKQLVPMGTIGEIYVGGAGVARGYLNRPELTAERFVTDPFKPPGARMYRTGDLAKYLPDGNLEFIGRNDRQVKIRGYRIELEEIEARLAAHPSVRDAVVIVRQDAGDKRLVAYVTTDDLGPSTGASTLREHLATLLPTYMVPSAFVRLEFLPLTSNGKLDRRALPAPDADAVAQRAFVAPQSESEQTLANVWCELLGLERVGRHDHFFELGGHSLLAVRLMTRVQQTFGIELLLATVFLHPTLAALAGAVGAAMASRQTATLASIERVPREGRLALSFAQERLWFLSHLGESSGAYHIGLGMRIRGALDVGAWRQSLDTLVARHEVLRSVFVSELGEPRLEVLAATCGFALHEQDLADATDAEVQLRTLCQEEANAPFELSRGPLIRGRLIRLGTDEHVFLLTQHHIVSDGWSIRVMMRELDALYRAFAMGEGDPLPALAIQYPDYAAWQRKWVSGQRLEAQAAYWRRTLVNAPTSLELPTDRPRPAQQSFDGAWLEVELDTELTEGLKRLSQQHGTTLFMTLLAAWAAVLGRLTGQDDVVIGVPSANRNRYEIEDLIGFFVNTLALRIDLSGTPSASELLARVRQTALTAQDHQDLPFEQVVDIVQPPRQLDRTPVFQVMFAWQDTEDEALDVPGLSTSSIKPTLDRVKFDIELSLGKVNNCIAGGLLYARVLFDTATIERHRGYLVAMLRSMVADASQPVGRAELIAPAERSLQLQTWNATKTAYPSERSIHSLFREQVERTPAAVAVMHDDLMLTYSELNARANRLANQLIERGVRTGDRVATLLERGVELVVAELAILKVGGAYVPLDPDVPPVRHAWMIADCGAKVVVGESGDATAKLGAQTVQPEGDGAWTAEVALTVPNDAAAYVMYTSGSTGTPKGVVITHRGVNRLVRDNGYAEYLPSDRIAWVGNPAFDSSTLEVWSALLNGGCLVVISHHELLDVRGVRRVLQRHKVNVLNLTAALFHSFLEPLGDVWCQLRLLMVGADVVDPNAVRKLLRNHRPKRLLHTYGPTESTTFATTYEIVSEADASVWRLPIGRPIANTQIYVLDAFGQPALLGAVGELHIGGAGVAHGYLNRPELTTERFVEDPFSGSPNARMYRTGDLARYLPDGKLEFLGRNDQQVKIRGYRIELGEIEMQLTAHTLVREAVVIARVDGAGDKRLIAYVTAEPLASLASTLREYIARQLPEYMVPAAYVRLDALPLTPNGKVDRKALPEPNADALAQRAFEAPRNEFEQSIATLWCELLDVERVGRNDHFFELGGHSLLAVRLTIRLQQTFGIELALATVFLQPTLAALAFTVSAALASTQTAKLSAIPRVARDGRLALSFAQERLWFLSQLGEASGAYHIPLGFQLRGALDVEALRRSLDALVARHEALRSVFVSEMGEPHVELLPTTCGFALREHDLSHLADVQLQLRALCEDEARAPFDLAQGPLIRGRLIRLNAEDFVFLLTQHHIVSDGWSMGVMERELGALYRAFVLGQGDPLPALVIQYPDYAAWQRQSLTGDRLETQAAYWRRILADAPSSLELPTDRPRPALQSFDGATMEVHLDAELTRGLKEVSRHHGTTLFMTLLAAWAAVLGRLAGHDDVLIGVPSANRNRSEIEDLIGFFVNPLVVRVDLSGVPSTTELLARVRQTVLAAQDHQDLPFEQVVEIVQPPRQLDRTPVFQVMFAWENTAEGGPELLGLTVGALNVVPDRVKFDVNLSLREVDDCIVGDFLYARALFDGATMHRHRGYLISMLRAMVADAHATLARVELLEPDERTLLLETWNATEVPYPSDRCIHMLFEEQAARTPDAIAAVQDDKQLTYAELNRQANRLAHRLIALGVGPDLLVGICAERRPSLLVGLVAILKAGGAYVPLDPSYPRTRLHEMIHDAQPVLVLADEAGRQVLELGVEDKVRVVSIDDSSARTPESDCNPEVPGLTSERLVYVTYTSGSTGTPKGVMVEHRSLVNHIAWQVKEFGFSAADVVLQRTSVSFDASGWELWTPLAIGARLILLPVGVEREAAAIERTIEQHAVTVAQFVPSLLRLMGARGCSRGPACDFVFSGGEVLDRELAVQARTWARRSLVNLYGPTETTIDACAWACPTQEPSPSLILIGRPIGNTCIYILDAHRQPVPLGTVGELYIGGVGVARGYLRRPDLTADCFVPDPFGNVHGARMYRTGDLARYRPDGNLEFIGRNDRQVKIRGYRIELGEIEGRLATHPLVREAVVLAREDDGDKRLVAYVTTNTADTQSLAATLREHLSQQLPQYMVPSAYVQLEALPMRLSGKLDWTALPAPDDGAVVQRSYEAPHTLVELTLASLWCELLRLNRVGRQDHFFELGGHSLLAVRLMERLRQLGLETDVRALFLNPTLAALAATFGSHQHIVVPANGILPDARAITPEQLPLIEVSQSEIDRIVAQVPGGVANVQDIYALSPLQEGILFHHLLASEGDPYLLINQMVFPDRRLVDRYFSAVQAVVDRHDILRTSLVWEGLGTAAQVVWRKAPLQVTEVEVKDDGTAVREQLARRFDPRHHRIDLTRAPLLQFVIAREPGSERWVVTELLHHLIGDHSTLEILHAEVDAVICGRRDELAAAQPFRNLVAQARLGMSTEEHESFFQKLLADIDEPTIPFGLSGVHRDGRDVKERHVMLPSALNLRLRAHARRLGVSLASLCHVAWGQVVARTSGREQVVFGTVLFGRMHGNSADRAMGLYINTLPVRLNLDDTGVEASVRGTHEMLAELLGHEHASLALAQRCSGVASPAPLFSALLNYRHNRVPPKTDSAVEHPLAGVEWLGGQERTNYPVVLSVEDFGEALGLTAQVVQPVSPARVCAMMERTLEQLAEALEQRPSMPVRTLDVLPVAERKLLLETWNATEAPYPSTQCIHTLFEEQVARTPDAIAVVQDDTQLTYAELNAQANRLAHRLMALGVRPDRLVGLCVERRPHLVVGVLAILKAGGAYVPLDPSYPRARLAELMSDAAPMVVVADASGRQALALDTNDEVRLVSVDDPAGWAEEIDRNPKVPDLTSAHLAYVIYTSGSTGIPKGVMVEHAQVARLFEATETSYNFTECDVWCLFHSFAFDFSVWELWGALRYGGRLVIVPREIARSPNAFYDLVCEAGVTVLNQTPSAFRGFIEARRRKGTRHHLRYVIFGGEVLETSLLQPWYEHDQDATQLVNIYGPTEGTVFASCLHLSRDNFVITIGRPIANTQIYLLDTYGELVPVGAVGEIYIGGAGVARGYLNRPALTAERFVMDRFTRVRGARMYRTGDLARYLPDGDLEFIGRNDQQVKIRGYRIELGEIEARLATHDLVREAVVIAREDGGGDKRLVAYVTTDSSMEDVATTLREHLSRQLPGYMVPSAYVRLDTLPLTSSGKLDRKALPTPDDAAVVQRTYEAPQTAVEQTLAALWCELLGLDRVGRHDNFFELGGHSLLAVRLMTRLQHVLRVELKLAAVFGQPTLAALAETIGTLASAQTPAPPMGRVSREERLVLSFAQERLWFLSQMGEVSGTYHIPLGLQFRGALDVVAWRRSLDALVTRHEALRSVFVSELGEVRVKLLPATCGFALHEHDLSEATDTEAQVRALCEDEAHAPFDLARGPLIRGRLIRLGAEEHVFLLTQHHIVSDGWSMGVLMRELGALYRAFVSGGENPLPTLEIQYPDYAAWQRQWVSGERLAKQATYWRHALTDAPALLELPTDRPRPAQQSFDGAAIEVKLDAELTRGLTELSQQHGTTLFMTLLTAWAAVLGRLAGQDEVVIGVPSANRNRREVEDLIGFFVNTLALRIDLSNAPSATELLGRVREVTVAAQDHQDLPFEHVVEIVQPPRQLDRTPVFQVMFAWQNNEGVALDLSGLAVGPVGVAVDRVKFDVELSVGEVDGCIVGELLYACALFDLATMERHRGYLVAMLQAMVADPSQAVVRAELLAPAERKLLLETWNATEAPYPSTQCIHTLFEEQVARTPDAIAVVQDDTQLTYAELNAQANRLAHRLMALGVRPDRLVGLCVERRPHLVVGVLAILKAGGAYVPLDPSYPRARLAELMSDAAPMVVVADASGRQALALDTNDEVRLVSVDDPAGWAEEIDRNPKVPDLTSAHLAYVIYTSGSTGTPKGVQNEHRAIVNRLVWMQHTYGLNGKDVVLQKTPYGFDVSAWELFWTLMYGATMLLAIPNGHRDARYLVELIQQFGVTIVHFVPSMLSGFLEAPGVERCISLRRIICSGESLPAAAVAACRHAIPESRLDNLYGPTEAAIDVTSWGCPNDFDGSTVPIGRPIANTQIYLLDAYGELAPVGAVGEIYIGGAGVARGYLNRPALTAERFVMDRFTRVRGARMYRTGDLARYLPDGNLEFIGRNDQQVKIRGYRIELGEIEARLATHDLVREAVVIAREDGGGDKRLVAYVTTDSGMEDVATTLREHLSRQLPGYMVPSAYVRLDTLPLTSSGKLDRKALPTPDDAAVVQRTYEAPQTAVEQTLAALWCELLGLDRVGRHDNFFELGGHSLLAVRLMERLRQLGIATHVRTLFLKPTLVDLAATLGSHHDVVVPPNGVELRQLEHYFGHDALRSMKDELDSLSPEELMALLSAEQEHS